MQSFPMLFYRKDVLADLGLEVPQTWEDVYRILPDLQNHHLEFGLWPSYYTFLQFLYQKGVAIFKEDAILANLESEAAIATFEEMTNLYTQSGLPLEYNFVNRFRMGDALAIANYGDFNTSLLCTRIAQEWGWCPFLGLGKRMALSIAPFQWPKTAGRRQHAARPRAVPGPAIVIPRTTGPSSCRNRTDRRKRGNSLNGGRQRRRKCVFAEKWKLSRAAARHSQCRAPAAAWRGGAQQSQ